MKFPFCLQHESMDCGPACLCMIARYHGRQYGLEFLREKCGITREGVSMLSISDAAESIGLHTEGVKLTWEQLCSQVPLPCIVHWQGNHFVVVYRIKRDKVYVADPSVGLLVYSVKAFLNSWQSVKTQEGVDSGLVLLLEPTPAFFKELADSTKKPDLLVYLRYLYPYRRYVIQLGAGLLAGSLISIILPFLTQAMVDVGIGNQNIHFILLILLAQVMLTIGQTANEFIRNWLLLHITSRISISLISDFLSKLMKLPIAFFDTKRTGDILQRIGDYNRIQSFLTGSLISIFMAVMTFLIYCGVMARYNLNILLVFIIGSILYILWVLMFMKRRRKLDYMRFQEAAVNQETLVQLITGMQDIKLNNCERSKRWGWERVQARLFRISLKGLSLGQMQEAGGLFIGQTKNVLMSYIAATAVVKGDMSLGMMMALQYIIGQMNTPLAQFILFLQTTQDAKLSMERIHEIHCREEEEPGESLAKKEIPPAADIEFRDVVFQYGGPHSSKVLDHISLTVPARKVTAIVGASGSGKTTLLKLILGFYKPIEGEILLHGVPISQYSIGHLRRKCGVVMQEGIIFSDTIGGNIVLEETYDVQQLEQALQIANLDDFVHSLPLGIRTRVGTDGQGLSTGQKQRLLIARAAYRDPTYIMFDEATNALDANNEKEIMSRLERFFRGRTVIVVAHRLSTVKNADKIVVLNSGRIVEQGCHEELITRRGMYYNLVRNQLEIGN